MEAQLTATFTLEDYFNLPDYAREDLDTWLHKHDILDAQTIYLDGEELRFYLTQLDGRTLHNDERWKTLKPVYSSHACWYMGTIDLPTDFPLYVFSLAADWREAAKENS